MYAVRIVFESMGIDHFSDYYVDTDKPLLARVEALQQVKDQVYDAKCLQIVSCKEVETEIE